MVGLYDHLDLFPFLSLLLGTDQVLIANKNLNKWNIFNYNSNVTCFVCSQEYTVRLQYWYPWYFVDNCNIQARSTTRFIYFNIFFSLYLNALPSRLSYCLQLTSVTKIFLIESHCWGYCPSNSLTHSSAFSVSCVSIGLVPY